MAVLLEGDKELGIIKRLNNNEENSNYIVVSGLTYDNKKDRFEWNQGKYCKNILEAIEYYDKLKDHEIENKLAEERQELPRYRKLEMYEVFMDELFDGNNYSEAINRLHEMELSKNEICIISSLGMDELEDILEEEEDEY